MWKELFKGASKRFANDASKGIAKERERVKKVSLKQGIENFNAVSEDFYTRNNFLTDLGDLTFSILENLLDDSMDDDLDAELQSKLENYYYKELKQIKKNHSLPLTGEPLSTYDSAIIAYNQAIDTMQIFIQKRKSILQSKEESQDILDKMDKLANDLQGNRISEEEYNKEMDLLERAFLGIDEVNDEVNDEDSLIDIRNNVLSHQEEFIKLGDTVLKMLERKLK